MYFYFHNYSLHHFDLLMNLNNNNDLLNFNIKIQKFIKNKF